MRLLRTALITALLAVTACASKTATQQTSPRPTKTPTPTACSLQGANDAVKQKASPGATAPVTGLQMNDKGCPRIVFEFSGRVPGYRVEYAQPPFQDCGSGQKADTSAWNANAFLEIRMQPSGGVDLSKSATPTYKGSRDIAVDGAILKHLKVTCDFEAVFTWIVGLDAKHGFTVQTNTSPPQLIVDVDESAHAP